MHRLVFQPVPVSKSCLLCHTTLHDFVSKHDFDLLSSQVEEKFVRFEALLTSTNIFSTPKVPVSTATTTAAVSTQPFFNPSDPRGAGPVRSPGLDENIPADKPKEKKNKGSGKKSKKAKTIPSASATDVLPAPEKSHFYYVNTSYPMDNLLNRSSQTGPPNIRKRRPVVPPAGRSVVLCTPQMAPHTSCLSRQPDVIASFSFGACTVQTCFQQSPDILRKSVHYDGFSTLFANNLL